MGEKNVLELSLEEVMNEMNKVQSAVRKGIVTAEEVKEYIERLNSRVNLHVAALERDGKKGSM